MTEGDDGARINADQIWRGSWRWLCQVNGSGTGSGFEAGEGRSRDLQSSGRITMRWRRS